MLLEPKVVQALGRCVAPGGQRFEHRRAIVVTPTTGKSIMNASMYDRFPTGF